MPINGGTGAFNTGRDCTVVLMAGTSGALTMPNVTGFDAKQTTANINVDRLDGVQMNAELPKGWNGTFDLVRGDSAVEDFIAQFEAAWYQNGTYNVSTIYQYITETSGATTTYQFTNVALSLSEAGAWRGDQDVKQTITFRADRRIKVS